jgi:hypothetical protein
MTVVPVATRVAAVRAGSGAAAKQGAGKVIDVVPSKSTPLRNARPGDRGRAGRVSDAAAGAGASKLLDGIPGGKALTNATAPASHARTLLVAEFTACMAVLAFSPLTKTTEKPQAFMKRASATMGVFFVLALIATAGRGASRAAAGFGGLVTLVLLISQRSIFTVLTKKMGAGVGESGGGVLDEDALPDIVDTIGDIGDDLNKITPLDPLGPIGNGVW